MVDTALRPAPGQNAIAQDELNSFSLTIDAAIEGVEHLENLHRCACRLFVLCPFIAQSLPALERGEFRRIAFGPASIRITRLPGIALGVYEQDFVRRIVPPGLQPVGNLGWRDRRKRQLRALGLQDEARICGVSSLAARGRGLCGAYPPPAALDRSVFREVEQPESPGLFVNLPARGIAVLVERLQVLKDARQFVASVPELFGVHVRLPSCSGSRRAVAGRVAGRAFRITVFGNLAQ